MTTGSFVTVLFLICLAHAQPPDTLWTYTYASSINDNASCIAPTMDGGFIVGGQGRAPDSTDGALLIRLDGDGHQLWGRRYPELSSRVNSAIATSDGGFAMAGGCPTDFFGMTVVKIDSSGTRQWCTCMTANLMESAVRVIQTTEGGYAIVSVGTVISSTHLWLGRFDSNGDSLWAVTLGPPGSYLGGDFLSAENGDFIVAASIGLPSQAYVVRTDSMGEILWFTTFGFPTLMEELFALAVTPEGDYVVAGAQTRGEWTFNPYAARITASGDTLWTRAFPNLGPGWFYSVCVLPDSNIVLGGSTGFDFLTVLLNPAGDTLWSARYGTTDSDDGRAMCLTPDEGIAMAGYHYPHLVNQQDIWVVRTESLHLEAITPRDMPKNLHLLACCPNPFNATTTFTVTLPRTTPVTLSVFNTLGQRVREVNLGQLAAGEHRYVFDAGGLPSGVYLARMEAPGRVETKKVVLMR